MDEKLYQHKINSLIHKIGLENNLNDEEIRKIVESQFEFTREKLKEINKEINNASQYKDEFGKVFYYKALCKLYICEYKLKALLKRRNHINKINNND
jgi:hypothetical protein